MATEKLGFHSTELRNEAIRKLREAGKKGIAKYSTHEGNDPRIIYVVTWDEPADTKTTVSEAA